MELRYVLARHFALACFFLDVACQAYVFLDDFLNPPESVVYSPHPYALAGILVFEIVLQICWLYKLYSPRGIVVRDEEEVPFISDDKYTISDDILSKGVDETNSEPAQWESLPLYILGSLCQVGWAASWLYEFYTICCFCLTIGTVTQLYTIFTILNGWKNKGFPQRNILTHLITKSRAAIAMLLLWKTWGVLDTIPSPTIAQQLNNLSFSLIFAMSSGPDPTMGLFLAFVLFSLTVGPHQSVGWHQTFSWEGVVVLLVVLMDWIVGTRVAGSVTDGSTEEVQLACEIEVDDVVARGVSFADHNLDYIDID